MAWHAGSVVVEQSSAVAIGGAALAASTEEDDEDADEDDGSYADDDEHSDLLETIEVQRRSGRSHVGERCDVRHSIASIE